MRYSRNDNPDLPPTRLEKQLLFQELSPFHVSKDRNEIHGQKCPLYLTDFILENLCKPSSAEENVRQFNEKYVLSVLLMRKERTRLKVPYMYSDVKILHRCYSNFEKPNLMTYLEISKFNVKLLRTFIRYNRGYILKVCDIISNFVKKDIDFKSGARRKRNVNEVNARHGYARLKRDKLKSDKATTGNQLHTMADGRGEVTNVSNEGTNSTITLTALQNTTEWEQMERKLSIRM